MLRLPFIDEAEEEAIANVARFTTQLVPCTLAARDQRVRRGEKGGIGCGAGRSGTTLSPE